MDIGIDLTGTLLEWLTALGTVGSALVAVGIALYTRKISKKNEQNHALRYVFQLLDDNGHRNARRRIINTFGENSDERQIKILRLLGLKQDEIDRKEAILKESEEIVKADFDQIGTLLKNKEIPKDEFIKIYWHEVINCWKVLDEDIQKTRKKILMDDNYMRNFQELYETSTEHAKNKMEYTDTKLSKFPHKDTTIHPNLTIEDWNPSNRQFTIHTDEILDRKTLLVNETIYLVDDDNNKIDDKISIQYDKINSKIIVTVDEGQPKTARHLYLSEEIKDIYGVPLKKYVRDTRSI
ncbi:MAG TPA: hypothetical protein VJ697_15995 [Nitrososphaeraceae archaeon]|nr:hypothetical protein [Nitrososphaeraceae archaeon]